MGGKEVERSSLQFQDAWLRRQESLLVMWDGVRVFFYVI